MWSDQPADLYREVRRKPVPVAEPTDRHRSHATGVAKKPLVRGAEAVGPDRFDHRRMFGKEGVAKLR